MGTIIEQVSVAKPSWHVGPSALNLAVSAARDCLRKAHRAPDDVDLLINSGLYRDRNLGEPALAALIQEDVGAHPEDPHAGSHGTFSFDVGNGVCGVLNAAQIADGFLRSGAITRALLVASDSDPGPGMSEDFPFAAAGGAMLCAWTDDDRGFGPFYWASKPDGGESFRATVGFHRGRNILRFRGNGSSAKAFAEVAADAITKCLDSEELGIDAIDLIVAAPDDADFRAALAEQIGAPPAKLVGAGRGTHTAGLLFGVESVVDTLPPDSTVLFVAAGAGVTAGAVIYRTGTTRPERRPVPESAARLSPLDAVFLEVEDSDRHANLAIGGVTVVAGPVPSHDELLTTLAARIVSFPRYDQRLQFTPLDLNAPEWVPDPHFDIEHHVHRIALPAPGDDAALFDFVAERMSHRLDRDRPLWECWVIEGLADDRWAILVKIHHCIADGMSSTHALTSLCDEDGGESFAERIHRAADPHPHLPDLNPLHWPGEIINGSLGATAAVLRAATGAAGIAASLLRPFTNSSLNGPIGKQRRFAAARTSLSDIAEIQRAFGVTINDVALAAITEAYREVLQHRGEPPRPDSLRTLVPVSVRSADAAGALDNRVSLMLPLLPVDIADPVKRLKMVHKRLRRAKVSGQREAGSAIIDAAHFIPFMLTAQAVRFLTHLPQRGVVALATNVPGPSHTLHMCDREVLEMIPIPPIALRLRTGIAMLSHHDSLTFGIIGDLDTTLDVADIAARIERAVARLVELSRNR